jgi:hypothetical protein
VDPLAGQFGELDTSGASRAPEEGHGFIASPLISQGHHLPVFGHVLSVQIPDIHPSLDHAANRENPCTVFPSGGHKGKVHFVLVYNLTRFAREKYDHFALRAHLKSLGTSLRSASEPIDETRRTQLPRASDLWVQASLDQKQRLQQLFFPEGVAFNGDRFNRGWRVVIEPIARRPQERFQLGEGEFNRIQVTRWRHRRRSADVGTPLAPLTRTSTACGVRGVSDIVTP